MRISIRVQSLILNDIFLLRLQSNQVALTADIERAFLMIGIAENYQNVLYFLWVTDPADNPPQIHILHEVYQ